MSFSVAHPVLHQVALDKLLAVVNGDWRLPTIVHHCVPGCCSCRSEEESKELVFAVFVEAGACLGSDVNLPSVNRWGTCTSAAGKVGLFSVCHQVLPKILVKSFQHWRRCDPGEDANEHRALIRSKTWRSKCIGSDEGRLRHLTMAASVTTPMDTLLDH